MKRYAAEFIAVFFLVFVGTAAIVADQHLAVVQLRDTFGVLGVALAHGLALALAIAAVGRISGGHVNPAISIAFYVARRLSLKDLGGYVAAQLLGALTASLMVVQLFPEGVVNSVAAGVPGLGERVTMLQGGLIEVVLAFMLAFVFWGTAVDPKGPKTIAPLAIGLTVTFGMLAGAPFTGAAMNPARWFGPALVSNTFAVESLVWILGPIVGALIASTAYELFFMDEEPVGELEGGAPAAEVQPVEERVRSRHAAAKTSDESDSSESDSGESSPKDTG